MAIDSPLNKIAVKKEATILAYKGVIKIKSANLHLVYLQAAVALPSLYPNES